LTSGYLQRSDVIEILIKSKPATVVPIVQQRDYFVHWVLAQKRTVVVQHCLDLFAMKSYRRRNVALLILLTMVVTFVVVAIAVTFEIETICNLNCCLSLPAFAHFVEWRRQVAVVEVHLVWCSVVGILINCLQHKQVNQSL
jgi:hypothetical protein